MVPRAMCAARPVPKKGRVLGEPGGPSRCCEAGGAKWQQEMCVTNASHSNALAGRCGQPLNSSDKAAKYGNSK